jgi:hypothetical protein
MMAFLPAALLALLALACLAALALSLSRVAGALSFTLAGVSAALAALVLGAGEAALALLTLSVVAGATIFATGALAGEHATTRRRAPLVLALSGLALVALIAPMGYAPALPPLIHAAAAAAFAAPRGGDLFLALVVLVGVAGATAAVLGFGERGILGPDPRKGGEG